MRTKWITTSLLCPVAIAAQVAAPTKGVPNLPGATSYVVEVASFTLTPAQPKAGDNVTFQMTLRNSGSTAGSNVPWHIGLQGGSQMVGQGTIASIAAGSTQTVTATWRAVAGAQAALGSIAPPGVNSSRNTAPVDAKAKDLLFSVVQSSNSTAPSGGLMTTQLIDWNKVKVAGGGIVVGNDPGPCIVDLSPTTSSTTYTGSSAHIGEVVVYLSCGALPVGGRMNPVFFDNFALKNGWRVKTFNVIEDRTTCMRGQGWQVTTSPAIGSATPRTALALWANANCGMLLYVKLTIEGPSGTNPYQ